MLSWRASCRISCWQRRSSKSDGASRRMLGWPRPCTGALLLPQLDQAAAQGRAAHLPWPPREQSAAALPLVMLPRQRCQH
jgi:hypothetical protein